MSAACRLWGLAVLSAAAFSCIREAGLPEPLSYDRETGLPAADGSEASPSGAVLPGVAVVKFSEEVADGIAAELAGGAVLPTRSAPFSPVVASLGVSSLSRLFPYEERFEERTRREGLHRWYVVKFDRKQPLTRAGEELSSVPGVELVETCPVLRPAGFDDTEYSRQWNLRNDGKNGSVAGVDINVEPVWKHYTSGSPKVVVAVIDQGIQVSHPDLQRNIFEQNRNFITGGSVVDPGSHGTHVAGVIGAVNNNGLGVCGIAGGDSKAGIGGVKLMSCEILNEKTVDGKTENESTDAAPAFKWAADHGAVIAQNSWGYPADQNGDGTVDAQELESLKYSHEHISSHLAAAIDYFIRYAGCDNAGNQLPDSPMKGGLVVFAAGNDSQPYGPPAGYEPVVAVGAVGSDGKRSSFSNYGDWVDIAAPGSDIYSTVSGDKYARMSGTSMACPHVSGVAALVLSACGGRGFTNEMLKTCLLQGVNRSLLGANSKVGQMLDARGAVAFGDKDFPAQPGKYGVRPVSNSVEFTWKLGESPKGIKAYAYVLLAARDKALLEGRLDLNDLPEGVTAHCHVVEEGCGVGEELKAVLRGLDFESGYYVTLLAAGYGLRYAGRSEIKSVRTEENHPPQIARLTSEDLVLRSFEQKEVFLRVEDPDGHKVKLEFTPLEGTVEVAPAAAAGQYRVWIDGNSFQPGKYRLDFRLKDEYGLEAAFTLPFEVLPNHAPEKVRDLENILSRKPGEKFEGRVSDYFKDPDGETLKISFDISDKSVFHINVVDDRFYFSTLACGMSEVTVTATDAKGLSASASFKVLVRKEELFMELYPVPMTKVLYVRTGAVAEPTEVVMVSPTGAEVLRCEEPCSAFDPLRIEVSGLAPGEYAVRVSYGGRTETRMVVKQ